MRAYNLLQGSLWAPYKTGDHFMQSMAYIIGLIHNHVIDKNGNRIRLLDMYRQNIVTETVDGQKMKRIKWKAEGGFEDNVYQDEHGEDKADAVFYYNDYTDEKTGLSARDLSLRVNSVLDKVVLQLMKDPSERSDIFSRLTDEEQQLLRIHAEDVLTVGTDTDGHPVTRIQVDEYEKLAKILGDLDDKTKWSQRNESDLMD